MSDNGGPWPAPPADALLEASPDALVVVDDAGRVARVSEEAVRLLGYPRDELIGLAVDELVPDDQRDLHRVHRERFSAAPRRRPMGSGLDLHARRKDGQLVPVDIALSPVEHDGHRSVLLALRDVSARRVAEARQRAIDRALEATGEAVFMFDRDTLDFLYANRGAEDRSGYGRRELTGGMAPLDISASFTEEEFADLLAPLLSGELPSRTFVTGIRHRDGHEVPVEVTLELPGAADGGTIFVAIARDVAERIEREREIRGRLHHFQAAFENLLVPTAIIADDHGDAWQIVEANNQLGRLLGVEVDDLRGVALNSFIVPEDGPVFDSLLDPRALGRGTMSEARLVRPDGRRLWVEVGAAQGAEDRAEHVVVQFLDVTARIEAAAERDRHRRASAMLADRERIARDLHDMVIQRLFAAGMGLQAVEPLTDGDVADRLRETVDTLDESIAELRTTIFDLGHDDRRRSFPDHVRRVADNRTAQFGIEVDIQVDPDLDPPERLRESLLATLGEALANVGRHAAAERVEVIVQLEGDRLVLVVRDDGVGLPEDAPRGNGIDNMMWRATSFGGRCVVEPGPRTGTVLRWEVPA
ncbi:MAG: PAS domain S-box protein, partial [Actinomycetota bacterium]